MNDKKRPLLHFIIDIKQTSHDFLRRISFKQFYLVENVFQMKKENELDSYLNKTYKKIPYKILYKIGYRKDRQLLWYNQ
jgi:hypothetical protein